MLRTKIKDLYKRHIYRNYPQIRGTTRIMSVLERVSEIGLRKVDDAEVSRITDLDWDNLIILDAGRFDYYKKLFNESGYRISAGSSTAEYIKKNFSEGSFSDVVYISSNPHTHHSKFKDLTGRTPEKTFYELYECYITDWDSDVGGVRPEPVYRDAKSANKLFPDKRLIVHFMQPHIPFINYEFDVETTSFTEFSEIGDVTKEKKDPISLARKGVIDESEIRKAYKSNLREVMPFVEALIDELTGKTVVTADHGNFLGENGLYGHPYGSDALQVRKVPWDVYK